MSEELKRLPDSVLERDTNTCQGLTLFGIPMVELDRDSLLYAISYLYKEQERERKQNLDSIKLMGDLAEAISRLKK